MDAISTLNTWLIPSFRLVLAEENSSSSTVWFREGTGRPIQKTLHVYFRLGQSYNLWSGHKCWRWRSMNIPNVIPIVATSPSAAPVSLLPLNWTMQVCPHKYGTCYKYSQGYSLQHMDIFWEYIELGIPQPHAFAQDKEKPKHWQELVKLQYSLWHFSKGRYNCEVFLSSSREIL